MFLHDKKVSAFIINGSYIVGKVTRVVWLRRMYVWETKFSFVCKEIKCFKNAEKMYVVMARTVIIELFLYRNNSRLQESFLNLLNRNILVHLQEPPRQ